MPVEFVETEYDFVTIARDMGLYVYSLVEFQPIRKGKGLLDPYIGEILVEEDGKRVTIRYSVLNHEERLTEFAESLSDADYTVTMNYTGEL